MKQLEDIFRIEGDHVIIDCCPRDSNRTPPYNSQNTKEDYEQGSMLQERRAKYTVFLNVNFLLEDTKDKRDNPSFVYVNCHQCNAVYRVSYDFVSKAWKKVLKGRKEKHKEFRDS